MEAVVLVIHLIVALAIIGVVMLQPAETGGFTAGAGSMSNLGAPRRSGDVLSRLTAILAGIFFLTSLTLAILAENRMPDKSILDAAPPAAEAPAPKAAETEKSKEEKPAAPISQ